jgi:putative transposase
VKRKRHSAPEVTAKLHQADQMAADGMLQSDIARTLGVSVMTYHRWRAGRPPLENGSAPERRELRLANQQSEQEQAALLDKLKLENSRLRRLVTDLLLEKVNLEEKL